MDQLISYAMRTTIFLMMVGVGLDCTASGLRGMLRRVPLVLGAAAGPFLVAVPLTWGVCLLLRLSPTATAALLLLACCPSGAITNTYTFLARGSTTLSVALTTVSCLVSLALTPLALRGVRMITGFGDGADFNVPFGPVLSELATTVVLPVAIGVFLRTRFSEKVLANMDRVRKVSLLLLVGLIVLIAAPAPGTLLRQCWAMIVPAILVSAGLLFCGWLVGRLGRLAWAERTAILFEFPCRNLAVVALVGLNILGQPELVIFATGFFLVQSVMMLPAAWSFARIGARGTA